MQCLFCSIFILLSRESDGGTIFCTNPHPLRSCPFPSFTVVSLTFYYLVCCLFEATKQRNNLQKEPYPRTQQRRRQGWELNLDHDTITIVIAIKATLLNLLATLPTDNHLQWYYIGFVHDIIEILRFKIFGTSWPMHYPSCFLTGIGY